jgi:hypothetical protein
MKSCSDFGANRDTESGTGQCHTRCTVLRSTNAALAVRVGQTSNGNALRTANIPILLLNSILYDYATSVVLLVDYEFASELDELMLTKPF